MPFDIPTLPQLADRGRKAFRSYLPGSDAWLWPNNIYVAAKVLAETAAELFGFADYIAKQQFALTADGEHLDMHGAELNMSKREARPAIGPVVITTSAAWSIDAGGILQRSDGAQYSAQAAASIAGAGTVTVNAEAITDGRAGNAEAGTALALVSGFTGDPTATAVVGSGGIIGGADVEPDGAPYTRDLSTWRGRILFRKGNPPFGGAPADYVLWCGQVPGVTRTFVERLWNGPGSVRVFPMFDDLYSDGIGGAADIARVATNLELVQPSDALVTVQAPIGVPVNVTISGLTPNTTTVQEAIKAELRAAFRRLNGVAGISSPHPSMPYLATPRTFAMQWIWGAVNIAPGEVKATVVAPTGDVALTPGQIATLGTVTFV